jgi:hypothetical protein
VQPILAKTWGTRLFARGVIAPLSSQDPGTGRPTPVLP